MVGDGDIPGGRCHRDSIRDGGGGPGEEAIDLGKLQKIKKNMIKNEFALGQRALAWLEDKSLFFFLQNWLNIGQNFSRSDKVAHRAKSREIFPQISPD